MINTIFSGGWFVLYLLTLESYTIISTLKGLCLICCLVYLVLQLFYTINYHYDS